MVAYLIAALLSVLVQSPAPQAPCADQRYREFDFWVGDWEVADATGKPQGTNRVERIEGGCAIQENWSGAGGMTGRSVNVYRPATGKWHQLWVSSRAAVLLLEGQFDGAKMVLSGSSDGPSGATVYNRITWTPLSDGTVRQVWEQSSRRDGAWTVVFDGFYTRRRGANDR